MHGRPWMPWQHDAAARIGELTPAGHYRHKVFLIGEPRQTGKTTLALDLALGRGIAHRDYRAKYAAQTGHVTTQRFAQLFKDLESGPLHERWKLRRSAGTEEITDRRSGSWLGAYAPMAGALRSFALDLVIVDEAQEHGADLGAALDATILPTFTTRPRHQLLIVYSAGTDSSAFLRKHRTAALSGAPGYGIYEHGATDADDLTDPDVWARVHPGIGHTTDTDFLATALATDPAGFPREFMNVWTRTSTRVIDPAAWQAANTHPAPMPPGRLAIGVDVGLDVHGERATVAIAIAGPLGHVELVEHRPIGSWAQPRLVELAARHHAGIAVDRYGPAGTLHDALALAGAPILPMGGADVANATAAWLDDLGAARLRVWPHPDTDAAAQVVVLRPLGDAGLAWSRKHSPGNIAPLTAASFARWALLRDPGAPATPTLTSG